MPEAIIKQEEMSITETQKAAMDLFNPDGKAPEIDQLPKIEIVHAAQMFKMPGNNVVPHFFGAIIDTHPNLPPFHFNAWWEKPIEEAGGNLHPDCCSDDGIKPKDVSKALSPLCATCPLNQYGSDPKGGKGKACKNMRRLFILIPGFSLPLQLVCSATSLKSISPYITEIRGLGWPYQAGNAKFSLIKVETYSVLKIEVDSIEKNMDALQARVKIMNEFQSIMHKQEISLSDYTEEKE